MTFLAAVPRAETVTIGTPATSAGCLTLTVLGIAACPLAHWRLRSRSGNGSQETDHFGQWIVGLLG